MSKRVSTLRTYNFSKLIKIYHPPTVKDAISIRKLKSRHLYLAANIGNTITMTPLVYFLSIAPFFFLKESISQFSFCQRTYLNNQPCDQAISDITEHSSSNRKQIQVKDMAQSHTEMELYSLNVSQLYSARD